ncbi:MAG TPA: ABC transporter ATP-binding protein [Hyphomicrobiaceae bacterium]|nr:ABC transporter ATP-binding protein [Hyphomicrobiaceae bacterium]
MLDKLYAWFETRLPVFRDRQPGQPPTTLAAYYWHFVGPVWPAFVAFLAVGLVGSVIEVMLLAFVGSIVDLMKASASPQSFLSEHAWTLVFMAFVALVLRPAISMLHDLIKNQMISVPLTTSIRWETHRYVLRQSLGFFQNDFAGRVSNKIMQNAQALRESAVQAIDALWYAAVHFLGALVLFWQADVWLAVPLIVWMIAYGLALRHFVPRIQKLSAEVAEARSMLMGRITDSYTNIMTVKLFAHTDREDAYAREALTEQMTRWNASMRNLTTMETVIYVLNGALMVVTTGLAIWLWGQGHVSLGAIAVVTGLILRLVAMSGWIFWVVAGIFDNIGTVQEGMETISKPHLVVDDAKAKPLVVTAGEIRFEKIRFDYGRQRGLPGADPGRVINDLTLTIAPGEKVGLVGRSGAGKSTLVNLLLRFHDLEGGRILIDGQDIRGVQQDSLRGAIGMVTQDTSLMHRSVRDNILYGRPDATEAELAAAAQKAQAHEFIPGLEDGRGRRGYEAHVGERGVKLSGGQRQRIALARVLLKNAPILVLDEATSALDSEVEAAIQEQLANLMEGKTVIAIAHRLSTIAAMDRLVIMDRGKIVETGAHRELLARGGLYADLWDRQSGGFLAADAAQ